MMEIEQKFRLQGNETFESALKELGAHSHGMEIEEDHYFNSPDRDFARTGEALRIRRVGEENFLTYKGPKLQQEVKIRKEIEIPIPPGDVGFANHESILKALGYKFVEVVRKKRQCWKMRQESFEMTLCLDDVEGLGRFMEVEIIAQEAELEAAAAAVRQVGQKLGLDCLETRSYLRMVLEKGASQ